MLHAEGLRFAWPLEPWTRSAWQVRETHPIHVNARLDLYRLVVYPFEDFMCSLGGFKRHKC